jgi:uncharacterized protein YdeI (YjbR/CyaY-like superfamily)
MLIPEDSFEVRSIAGLRAWLAKNHTQKMSFWLITYKKVVPEFYLEYSQVVDELLCFGWIDSLPRSLDAQRKMLRISPRKPRSAWSKINRDKVKKLIASGKMTDAGLEAIQRAKRNGSWDLLKETDNNVIPSDLKRAFKMYPKSSESFSGFPPSAKRAILEWIALAKRDVTRASRVDTTAKLAAKNIRANFKR